MKVEIYDSLDAPVYIWNKVHSTNDYSFLLVEKRKLTKKLLTQLQKAWEKIYDEYLKEFGFSEEFLSIKDKEIDIAIMKCNLILTGDRTLLTSIQFAEQELSVMQKSGNKSTFTQSVMAIEKKFHFQIDEHKTSIRKYYTYLKEL